MNGVEVVKGKKSLLVLTSDAGSPAQRIRRYPTCSCRTERLLQHRTALCAHDRRRRHAQLVVL